MNFEIINIDLNNNCFNVKEQIWEMVCSSDNEFIPPLSVRDAENTVFNNKLELTPTGKPYVFYNEVLNENIIGAFYKDELVGFLAYETDYMNDDLKKFNFPECWYVNALIVKQDYRRKGIAIELYDALENHAKGKTDSITTRTWSSNYSHINLIKVRDYNLIITLKDHRGEGIDTVYFRKTI